MKLKHGGFSAAISFLIALAGAGCLVTGFELDQCTNWPILICILVVWSGLSALLFSRKHGGKILWILLVCIAGCIFHTKPLLTQVESLLYQISRRYDSGYRWGYISWSQQPLEEYELTLGLALLGGLVITMVCWVVLRRKPSFPGLIAGLVPLALCCVLTDTVPAVIWLAVLLISFVLLLLSQGVRRRSAREGLHLTALLLVPVLLLSGIAIYLMPPERYEEQSKSFHDAVLSCAQRLPFITVLPDGRLDISLGSTLSQSVDLTQVGPKGSEDMPVMDVVSTRSGILYLRGQVMDTYDGKSWSSEHSDSPDPYWPVTQLRPGATVEITTRATHPVLYQPYYTGSLQSVQTNRDRRLTYRWEVKTPAGFYSSAAWEMGQSSTAPWLQLPEDTRKWGRDYLQRQFNTPEFEFLSLSSFQYYYSRNAQAELISRLVRRSAQYDLNTPAMPADAQDFAIWFLENSDTGYCTHFATAAVVLLRSAGIPARYVTGYTLDAGAKRRTTVLASQAHAWVEYLDDDLCWKTLDPTPGGGNLDLSPTEDTTAPTEETTAPTEETDVPTAPTEETTAPTEDTTAPTFTFPAPTGSTSAPTEGATAPTGDTPPAKEPVDLRWLWTTLQWLAILAGVAGILFGQYLLRLHLRQIRMHTGEANRQAIACWRYARLLGKILRVKPPMTLYRLAEKAAFSQHTLTEAELSQFYHYHSEMLAQLNTWKAPLRLTVKLIFAIG